MSWKYGTILHDHEFDRRLMVVREIPKEQAGESDLFEAMVLDDGDDGRSEIFWVAISPRDTDVHEIMDEAEITIGGVKVGSVTASGTWRGHLEIEPAPPAGQPFTISYEER